MTQETTASRTSSLGLLLNVSMLTMQFARPCAAGESAEIRGGYTLPRDGVARHSTAEGDERSVLEDRLRTLREAEADLRKKHARNPRNRHLVYLRRRCIRGRYRILRSLLAAEVADTEREVDQRRSALAQLRRAERQRPDLDTSEALASRVDDYLAAFGRFLVQTSEDSADATPTLAKAVDALARQNQVDKECLQERRETGQLRLLIERDLTKWRALAHQLRKVIASLDEQEAAELAAVTKSLS